MKVVLLLTLTLVSSCAFAKDEQSFVASDEVRNAASGVELLRASLRDPDSMVVEHVYAKMSHKPDHPLICIAYRAKNGFGGYGYDIAEYKGGRSLQVETIGKLGWCGGIERNLDRAIKKGWSDITAEYRAQSEAKP